MPYCPEDSTKLVQVYEEGFNTCYNCPYCHTHWRYDGGEGSYQAYMESAECICEGKVVNE